jgi:hypothetical protein
MIFAMTYYRVHTHAAGLSDGPNLFALNNLAWAQETASRPIVRWRSDTHTRTHTHSTYPSPNLPLNPKPETLNPAP